MRQHAHVPSHARNNKVCRSVVIILALAYSYGRRSARSRLTVALKAVAVKD